MDDRQENVVTGWDYLQGSEPYHDRNVALVGEDVTPTGASGSSPTQGIDTPAAAEAPSDRARSPIVHLETVGFLAGELAFVDPQGSSRAARSEARTEPAGPAGPESRTSGPLPLRFVCWGCGRAALDSDLSFAALFEDVPVQGLRVSRCRMCGAGMLCFEAGFFTDTDIEELRAHFERSLPSGAVSP